MNGARFYRPGVLFQGITNTLDYIGPHSVTSETALDTSNHWNST